MVIIQQHTRTFRRCNGETCTHLPSISASLVLQVDGILASDLAPVLNGRMDLVRMLITDHLYLETCGNNYHAHD